MNEGKAVGWSEFLIDDKKRKIKRMTWLSGLNTIIAFLLLPLLAIFPTSALICIIMVAFLASLGVIFSILAANMSDELIISMVRK